jgi:hypothetical protein
MFKLSFSFISSITTTATITTLKYWVHWPFSHQNFSVTMNLTKSVEHHGWVTILVTRPVPAQENTKAEETWTSMLRLGLEPTVLVFECAKPFDALDCDQYSVFLNLIFCEIIMLPSNQIFP